MNNKVSKQVNNITNGQPKNCVQKNPGLSFLVITFVWSWLIWLGAIALGGRDDLLLMVVVFIGGFGPAIGGILTLALQGRSRVQLTGKQTVAALCGAVLIFGLMALRYIVGTVPGYEPLATDLTLSLPIIAAAVIASLVGGLVIASAFSQNSAVRSPMQSLLPWKTPTKWTLFSLIFYPAMVLLSWGLASVLGMEVEYPGMWGRSVLEVLPLALLSFALTALARGGNEEPGWRGMMQPALQGKMSPLAAALIVSLAWSLWHLPLYLNGFYSEPLLMGMIGGGIFRIFLAIFLAWVYNRSGEKLLPMIILHTSFNMVVNFLPTNDFLLLVLWILVTAVVVVKDKMWRKAG
ncbi:MAG: CPBP family intramembrane metalloprotease [Anaerolineae bacterium]|nr:CPBP family intramembrane metalloprotease [Anaerolineae bacterium]